MSDIIKLKYKVGEIEFEAEGPSDAVEQQRINFMNIVLPAVVSAMVQTHATSESKPYIETTSQAPLLEAGNSEDRETSGRTVEVDYSRTSPASFLKKYGTLSEPDFTLLSAYFDEKKNGTKDFSIESVKRYYADARRPLPKNPSMSLYRLAERGLIMDAEASDESKLGKCYMLSDAGLAYVENYVPKEDSGEKKRPHAKTKKTSSNVSEMYKSITANDLNLKNYPAVKSLSSAKEQVVMTMYIVVNEEKGEWFTVDDVIHFLVNIFEVPANSDMINNVFKRNKDMFYSEQDPTNKKAFRRKLLSGGKDFAALLVQNDSAKRLAGNDL